VFSSQAHSSAEGLRGADGASAAVIVEVVPLALSLMIRRSQFAGIRTASPKNAEFHAMRKRNQGQGDATEESAAKKKSEAGNAMLPAPRKKLPFSSIRKILEEIISAHDLPVEGARDERFALDIAGLGVGDGDVINLESAAHCALIVGFGFFEVR